jgi:sterol 3beta-glucosyltransferase
VVITLVTFGSDGDVLPVIALSCGLQKAGYRVRLATVLEYRQLVIQQKLEFIQLDVHNWRAKETPTLAPFRIDIHNWYAKQDFALAPFRDGHGYKSILKNPFLESFLYDLWEVCQGSDAIIFSLATFPCSYIAEKLKIPCWAAFLLPFHQTRTFTHPCMPSLAHLGSVYNLLSYSFYDRIVWQYIHQPLNKWRQEILGLSPLSPCSGIIPWLERQKIPCLYGYSNAFLPKPTDWSDWVNVTGYWFCDRKRDWQPPQNLVEFLEAGSPPVYIGFGNKGYFDPEKLTKLLLEALEISGQRGILLIGEDLSNKIDLPDRVFVIDWVPFDWLFLKVAAVVHHGGLGTIHAAMKAGIPSIIIPYEEDNLFWAQRVAKLNLGSFPILKQKLSANKLAEAIDSVVNNKTIHQNTAYMSNQIQREKGVERATEVFTQSLKSRNTISTSFYK